MARWRGGSPLQRRRHLDRRRHYSQLFPVVVAVYVGLVVVDAFHVIALVFCPIIVIFLSFALLSYNFRCSVLSTRGHSFLYFFGHRPFEERQR